MIITSYKKLMNKYQFLKKMIKVYNNPKINKDKLLILMENNKFNK